MTVTFDVSEEMKLDGNLYRRLIGKRGRGHADPELENAHIKEELFQTHVLVILWSQSPTMLVHQHAMCAHP